MEIVGLNTIYLEREMKFEMLKDMFRCHSSEDRSRLRAFVDNLDAEVEEYRKEEAYAEYQENLREQRKAGMEDE
jgi:hypothetical protein